MQRGLALETGLPVLDASPKKAPFELGVSWARELGTSEMRVSPDREFD